MKKGVRLIILLAVLVVVAGGYLLINHFSTSEEDADSSEDSTTIQLVDRSSDEIATLNWSYNGSECNLELDGGIWVDPDDDAYPVDQDSVDAMAEDVCSVTSSRTITDVTDLSQYGLDVPVLTLTVGYNDGTEDVYEFGSENSLTSEYYVLFDNGDVQMLDDTVYSAFCVLRWDLISSETIPTMDDPSAVTIESASGELDLEKLEDSGLTYTDEYDWFASIDGEYEPVDSDDIDEIVSSLESLEWSSVEAYDATDEELAEWGLLDPAGMVTVYYDVSTDTDTEDSEDVLEETFTLELGNYGTDGCYARLANSSMVYLIDSDTADTFLFASYDGMLPDDICLIDMDALTSFDIILDGETYTIVPGEEEVVTDSATSDTTDAESTVTETVKIYTCGDVELDADSVDDILATLSDMNASSTGGDVSNARSDVISFVFHRGDGEPADMTLTFCGYNSEYYLVEFNGWSYMLASKTTVDDLVTAVEALFVS